MKHISSKLILFTLILTSTLLLLTASLSFDILKRESRAYTFQGQLLQSQLFSESIKSEFSRTEELSQLLLTLRPDSGGITRELKNFYERFQKTNPNLKGIGVRLLGENSAWKEFPEASISPFSLALPSESSNFVIKGSATEPEFIQIIPIKNAILAIKVDLSKSLQNCSGLNIGLFNSAGELLYNCSPEASVLFAKASGTLKEMDRITSSSGTLERSVNAESYLWAFSKLPSIGKIISATTLSVAYAPAYALAVRVMTLILMALGAAIVASILIARKITGPIEKVTLATQKIASGDFDSKIDLNTKDETRTLANSVESMATKIKALLVSEVEKAKLDAQLEVAGAVQRTLIPKSLIEMDSTSIHSYYRPADQCGGDWWGYVKAKDSLVVLIGDVSGHGYASALLVATTKGFLSMLQKDIGDLSYSNIAPNEILKTLNSVVFDATQAELNMTSMCFVIQLKSGEFKLSNAGHNAAYLIDTSQKIESLRADGPRLGEKQKIEGDLEVCTGKIASGDRIVLYTDGIQDLGTTEAPLGRKGFKNFLTASSKLIGSDLVKEVETKLYPLNQGRPLQDDITFVVIERMA